MVRHVLGRDNYRQWSAYKWSDYRERATLATTFVTRHMPLSDGGKDRFGTLLQDPDEWDETPHNEQTRDTTPPPAVSASAAASTTRVKKPDLMWDSDEEEWVTSTHGSSIDK